MVCGGLACRKTIVVTVTVISNGVEIAITAETYVRYAVYVRYDIYVPYVNDVPFHYVENVTVPLRYIRFLVKSTDRT